MASRHILVRDRLGMLRALFWIMRPAQCCCYGRWLANSFRSDASKTLPSRPRMGPVVNFQHRPCGESGIALDCGKPLMAEPFLDGGQIRASLRHLSFD